MKIITLKLWKILFFTLNLINNIVMLEFLKEHLQWITPTVLIPLITWLARDKYIADQKLKTTKLEQDDSSSDIISKNLGLYQRMLDDVESRYEDKLSKRDLYIQNLENEIEELRKRIKKLEEIKS